MAPRPWAALARQVWVVVLHQRRPEVEVPEGAKVVFKDVDDVEPRRQPQELAPHVDVK